VRASAIVAHCFQILDLYLYTSVRVIVSTNQGFYVVWNDIKVAFVILLICVFSSLTWLFAEGFINEYKNFKMLRVLAHHRIGVIGACRRY